LAGLDRTWSAVLPLKPVRKLYSKICALADLALRIIVLIDGQAYFFECSEQPVKILGQKLPTKSRIDPCPSKLLVGDWFAHRRGQLNGKKNLAKRVCRNVTVRRST
jgi:hypothetical protein